MVKKISLILLLIGLFAVMGAESGFARRGRSFGGRSFGSSRRSYGSSRRRSYGSRRYGGYRRYGSRRYGYSRGGYVRCGGGGLVIMGIVVALIVIVVVVALVKRGKNAETPGMGTIVMLQVAFYADAEGDLRKEFNMIGRRANFDSPSGLAQFLNQTMIFIGRHIDDVSHYHYECSDKKNIDRLEDEFETKVSSEKMKYDAELEDKGKFADEGDEMEINQHVVLSTFVATERVDFKDIQVTDAHKLKEVVNKIAGISARSIYAIEVILDPSDEAGSLSRETMEIEFPKLIRL
jgi:uncharacterized membrane protein